MCGNRYNANFEQIRQPMGIIRGIITLKKEIIRYIALSVLIVLFGLFVYPTMYKYDKFDQRIPVKINRITGKTEFLYAQGWTVAAPTTTPSPTTTPLKTPEPSKEPETYNGETYKQYYSRVIKELKPGQPIPDEDSLYLKWKRAALGLGKMVDPKDYFTIGSSQEEVKAANGVPTAIYTYSSELVWHFNQSTVTFVNGRVTKYSNTSSNLYVY